MKKLRHSGSQVGESSSRAWTTVQWHPGACPGKARSLVFTEGPAAPLAARSFASVDLQHPGSPSAPQRSLGLTEPPSPRMRYTEAPKSESRGPAYIPSPSCLPLTSYLVIWQGSFLTLLRNVSAVPRCRGSGRSRATPLREWPPRDPLLRKGTRKRTG